jgi:hypothetical protein
MVGSSAHSATSDAYVLERLGRVHPKLVSSTISKSVVFISSTGQVNDLQSAHECSQHLRFSLALMVGTKGPTHLWKRWSTLVALSNDHNDTTTHTSS